MSLPVAKPKRGVSDQVDNFPVLQAAAVLAQAQNAGYVSGEWPAVNAFAQPAAVAHSTEQPHNRLQSRPQSASAHKRKGWHALQQGTAPQPGHTRRQSNSSALYVRPDRTVNANIALDNSPSFPSLAIFADALPTPHTTQPADLAHPSRQNSWASPSGKSANGKTRINSQESGSSASPGTAALKPAQQYSAALSPAKASKEEPQTRLNSGVALSDSELTNITSLLSTHPWAEPGLARAVLAAVNHDIPAADLLLREMEQHQAPSGSDSDEDLATHVLPPQTLASQPAGEPQTLGQLHPNAASSPQTLKAPAPPTSRVSKRPSFSRGRKQTVEGENDGEVDLYYKYRGEALKLSRRWHKKLHQSANAFAAAQFSEGKALATEAHQIRARAQAAHAEAAQSIESAHNAGRGLGQNEIDLHGLHAVEAVEALDRRLCTLGQSQHHSQAAKLRVIVGRGNNSSGGEASLPRVIESHLLQRNMNYITGQGVITVYLRGLRR